MTKSLKANSEKAELIIRNLNLLVQNGIRKRKHVEGRVLHYRKNEGSSLAIAVMQTVQDFAKSRPDILRDTCENILAICNRPRDLAYAKSVLQSLPRGRADV